MIKAPKFWEDKESLVSLLLLPISYIYALVSSLRWWVATPWKPSVPIICVGNVTLGGAGKTPTAIEVTKALKESGYKPHILSRGYGASTKSLLPIRVDNKNHTYLSVGDEPLLLAELAPTWVCPDRIAAAKMAIAEGADVLVMDDGYQNPSIHKALNLLVIDAEYQFGNGRVFPAGPLRENVESALKRADMVLTIGDKEVDLPTSKEVVKARLRPNKDVLDKSTPYIGFAGIGRPEKFKKSLEDSIVMLKDFVSYPDHHPYSDDDLKHLKRIAMEHGAQLVTTRKDFMRMPPDFRQDICVVDVELVFDDPDSLRNVLSNKLNLK